MEMMLLQCTSRIVISQDSFHFKKRDPSDPSMAALSDWHENLHRASQAAPCCAPMLGSVPIHQPHPMQAIATLRFSQSREIDLQILLGAPGHLDYFDPLTTNQVILILLFILTRLSSSGKLVRFLCAFRLPFFLWRRHLARHIFSCDIY